MRRPPRIALVAALAGVPLTAAAVLLPPLLYFLLSTQYASGRLAAECALDGLAVGRLIEANPALWRHEHARVADLLAMRPRDGEPERRRVLDGRGALVGESADPLEAPVLTRAVPLYDAGVRVGSLEVSRSVRPLLVRSVLLLCALLPFGLLAFHLLRAVPLSAIAESERELRRERDRARAILEAADVALVIVDGAGRIREVNRTGAELVGCSPEELVGAGWLARFVEPDAHAQAATRLEAARAGERCTLACELVAGSGERRSLSWFLTPLPADPGAAEVLASGVDLTSHRRLEEQLRQAQKLEAIGRLAGGVSHEFNNVLSVIKGYAGVLLRELPPGDAHRAEVAEIQAATQRASAVTRSLLAFGRQQEVRPVDVELGEVLRRAEGLLRPLLPESVLFRAELDPRPLPILADALQIEQVLLNLAANARDAMPDGGTLTLRAGPVELGAEEARAAGLERPGSYARVVVTDSGPGIPAAEQGHVFEPFFTTKPVGQGTGLGLSIAYGILRQHRGTIRLENADADAPRRGASFTILLPLTEPPPPAAEDAAAEAPPPPPGGTETLLVAEDDDAVRRMLRRVLEGAGYAVVEAADGGAAVRAFRTHQARVRLALLDVVMPGRNGREVLEGIRAIEPAARAIFLSGHPVEPGRRAPVDLGGRTVLAKPVDPATLLHAVRAALDA